MSALDNLITIASVAVYPSHEVEVEEIVERAKPELAALRTRVQEAEEALRNFYAMVKGESPQLLDDDINAEAVEAYFAKWGQK